MDFYRVNTGNIPQDSGFGAIGNTTLFNDVLDSDGTNLKMAHDSYEVFVNKDKVGNKILLTQTDDAMDLAKYLKTKGFTDFQTNVDGNRILITVDNREETLKMKNLLDTYLAIR